MKIIIRAETPADYDAISTVNNRAFEREDEGNLVLKLRQLPDFSPALSLVAVMEDQVVGHILFHPVKIGDYVSAGMGPVAVLPEYQKRGVGSQMIRQGLDACKAAGYDSMIVLGHSSYYPRFGFVPASRFGITCQWDVPDEAFMALELVPGALANIKGKVQYAPEFDGV